MYDAIESESRHSVEWLSPPRTKAKKILNETEK